MAQWSPEQLEDMKRKFPMEELTISRTAALNGIPNDPLGPELYNVENVLRPNLYEVRGFLGHRPLIASSAYRNMDVNCLVGGAMDRAALQILVEQTRYEVVREEAAKRLRLGYGRGYRDSVSAHTSGLAADCICPGYGDAWAVCNAVKDSGIRFDQLIYEYGRWMHIAFGGAWRGQVLTILADGKGYTSGLQQSR